MKIKNLFKNWDQDDEVISPPYIIAEAGVNHEASIDFAYRLIDEAKEGGADAIKFQTYKADKIASKNSPAYWDTAKETAVNQYQLFKRYDRFWKKEFELLKKYCDSNEIEFLSTPFDLESATFLNDLMDVFKVSSSDITNKPFIEYICSFKKPIVLSTGASDLPEIRNAVSWVESKNVSLALLHCILNYPTKNKDANLGMIKSLNKEFPQKIIGYSDHTMPNNMETLEIATLLGAKILEKHFTFNKGLPGNDHYHSMDKDDLKKFVKRIKKTLEIVGLQKKQSLISENLARENARRSIVASCNLKEGEIIQNDHLAWKRPGTGVSPQYIDKIIGKKLKKSLNKDDFVYLEDVF